MTNWEYQCLNDAITLVENFEDQIKAQMKEFGEVPEYHDLDEARQYLWEHLDGYGMSLDEAAEVLSDLEDYEETDSGIWLDPESVIQSMINAAHGNIRNCVAAKASEILERMKQEFQDALDSAEEEAAITDEQRATIADEVWEDSLKSFSPDSSDLTKLQNTVSVVVEISREDGEEINLQSCDYGTLRRAIFDAVDPRLKDIDDNFNYAEHNIRLVRVETSEEFINP